MPRPRRNSFPTFWVIFCALLVYLTGNALVPLWDRDEPRYAQCSRQMLQSGDWVVPRLYDELRTAKPPVIYWVQAAAMAAVGGDEAPPQLQAAAARLPSVVAMILTLLLVAIVIRRAAGAEHAFWTVLVLASTVLATVAAKVCLTDSVLLVFITIGQMCVYRIWRGQATWPTIIVFGLVDGVALLTKGPVVFGIHLTTLATLWFLRVSIHWTWREWRLVLLALALIAAESLAGDYSPIWPGPNGKRIPVPVYIVLLVQIVSVLLIIAMGRAQRARISATTHASEGMTNDEVRMTNQVDSSFEPRHSSFTLPKLLAIIVLIVAVGLPWAILIEQRSPGFLKTMFFKEVAERSSTAQEGHQGPFGYYLVSIWPTFLPWSLILPAAFVLGWKRRGPDPRLRFALAAVFGPWLMLEEVRTKLPHYLLPCFIPLAYLAADAIVQCLRNGSRAMSERPFLRAAIIWAVIITLLGLSPAAAAIWFTPQPWPAIALVAAVAIGYAVLVVRLLLKQDLRQAMGLIGVGAMFLFAVIFRIYLPSCEFLQLSVRTADVLRENHVTDRDQVVMLDYKEPSLAFYQGGTIREHSNTQITSEMLKTPFPELPAKREAVRKAGGRWLEMPEWAVVTKEVWDASAPRHPGQEDPRRMLEVVAEFRGLDVADGMRGVTVMVVRRKAGSAATQPANVR